MPNLHNKKEKGSTLKAATEAKRSTRKDRTVIREAPRNLLLRLRPMKSVEFMVDTPGVSVSTIHKDQAIKAAAVTLVPEAEEAVEVSKDAAMEAVAMEAVEAMGSTILTKRPTQLQSRDSRQKQQRREPRGSRLNSTTSTL